MGAWGTGIFSDDTASDVRSDYRSLLESGVDDAHAMREILRTYTPDDTVVWLALAAAQSKLGRLDPTVAARALEVIDTDEDLEHWMDTEPKERRGRRRALARLRQTLTGPQPERQEVKLQWRHHTDLEVGDVLELSTESVSTLWAVVASDPGALGTHPMIRRLRYAGRRPSSAQEVFDRTRSGEIIAEPGWDEIWGVRMRSRDSDWTEAGFTRIESSGLPVHESIARTLGCVGITWDEITKHVRSGTNPFGGLMSSDDIIELLQ